MDRKEIKLVLGSFHLDASKEIELSFNNKWGVRVFIMFNNGGMSELNNVTEIHHMHNAEFHGNDSPHLSTAFESEIHHTGMNVKTSRITAILIHSKPCEDKRPGFEVATPAREC